MIDARLARIEAEQFAHKVLLIVLIDRLTDGMSNKARFEEIEELLSASHIIVDATPNISKWMSATARAELSDISHILQSVEK